MKAISGSMFLFESTSNDYDCASNEKVNDEKDARGNTALHFAAGMGLVERCRDLVEHFGADASVKNGAGLRPVDLALNMQEQCISDELYASYDEVVGYLDSIASVEDRYHYFHRDSYKLF